MAIIFWKVLITGPAIILFGLVEPAHAQIATDGSVGPRVELDGPEFDIRADLGRQAGDNLFHSFERFSLATEERATFSGPDQIRNVMSRVTGGARSEIDGTLHSMMPNADFYFINPAGILFGPNASLDLSGSFHVSTADEVRFRDGARFSADLATGSSFTVAAPRRSGFSAATAVFWAWRTASCRCNRVRPSPWLEAL
jgi:filamentous hemagglutinin family protein